MKLEMDKALELLALVEKREKLKRQELEVMCEIYEQIVYESTNKTGQPRKPRVRSQVSHVGCTISFFCSN